MKQNMQQLLSASVFAAFLFMAFGSEDNKKTTVASAGGDAEVPTVEILKQSSEYEPTMNTYTIHCRVKNNSDKLVNYVDLKATFYNKKKDIVGTGIGNAANLAPGAEKTIDVMALDVDNVETYEVQVDNVMN